MKTRHSRIAAALTACIALAGCIILASCNDDARDPAAGADPTTQPLIFSATVATPTTAVATPTSRANTAAGQWTDGDVVAVEMDGVVKKYIIKAAAGAGATATLSPADEANTHYWPGETASVRAWRYGSYGNYAWDRKPDYWVASSNQIVDPYGDSDYQRSDFLYAPAQSVSYDAVSGMGAGLTFYHQTARVEVRIRKAGLVDDGNKVDFISLGSAPGYYEMLWYGTFDASQINPGNGKYSGLTADETTVPNSILPKPMPAPPATSGYACCYEALVIPQNMDGKHLICIRVGGKYYYYKPKAGEANLQGGYTYTYEITVSEHGRLDVTVGTPIVGWEQEVGGSGTAVLETTPIDLANPQTISDNGAYLMTGRIFSNKTLTITGGKPLVIVRDLNFFGSIRITGGTPEIRVEGTNNWIQTTDIPAIWLDGVDANVRITGGGIHESELELKVNSPLAVIGTRNAVTANGDIEISNLTLRAPINNMSNNGAGAVIGTSGGLGDQRCGNITITDAYIIAEPTWEAPAIGFGSTAKYVDMAGTTYEIGDITITNSTIESTIGYTFGSLEGLFPAHIGSGAKTAETYKIGTIRINTNKSATEFFEKFIKTQDLPNLGSEVIVGFPDGNKPWNILWNGQPLQSITWDMVPGLQ